jgi:hypothetical protein
MVTQLEHDELTPHGIMVHDHYPADPDRQTTITACAGSSFAQVRHDDPVVAIDADTAFGRLGARGAPRRIKLLHEMSSPSSDYTARQPTLRGGSDDEAASTDRCGQEPSAAEALARDGQ